MARRVKRDRFCRSLAAAAVVCLAGAYALPALAQQASSEAAAQSSVSSAPAAEEGRPVKEAIPARKTPDVAPPVSKEGKLKPGVIASFGSAKNSATVNQQNEEGVPGEQASPIIGSVSRAGDAKCTVIIQNNSKTDKFSVNYDVVGISPTGNTASRMNYSATLLPGGSKTHGVTCRRDLNMQVVLKSGNKLKSK